MSLLGSLGSIFGLNQQTIGTIQNVAKGFLTGGPGGAITAGIADVAGRLTAPRVSTTNPGGIVGTAVTRLVSQPSPAVGPGMPPMLPQLPTQVDSTRTSGISLFPGGPMVGTQTTYSSPAAGHPGQGCGKGYHLNKTGYYTRQGYVAPGTRCVKNRRRNPLNPRALSRSISRISSAKNAAKFLSRVSVRERGCGCK